MPKPPPQHSPKAPALPPSAAALLAAHNAFRAAHHAQPLVWEPALAAGAQAWANACAFAHSSPPRDAGGAAYGESLFTSAPKAADYAALGRAAATAWYDEAAKYDYGLATLTPGTAHFTQLVWKGTTRLGCGVTTDCGGVRGASAQANFVVCRYAPPGNVYGQFEANVLPA